MCEGQDYHNGPFQATVQWILDFVVPGLLGVVSGVLAVIYFAIVFDKKVVDLDGESEVAPLLLGGGGACIILFYILQLLVFKFDSFFEMAILFFWIFVWIFTLISSSYSVWMGTNIAAFGRSILFYTFFSVIPFVIFTGTTKELSQLLRPVTNEIILGLIPSLPIIPYLDAFVIYSLVIVMFTLPKLLLDSEARDSFKEALFGTK